MMTKRLHLQFPVTQTNLRSTDLLKLQQLSDVEALGQIGHLALQHGHHVLQPGDHRVLGAVRVRAVGGPSCRALCRLLQPSDLLAGGGGDTCHTVSRGQYRIATEPNELGTI